MKDAVYIYALKDPDTGTIRYIGKSNNPRRRYNNHISNARNHRDGNRVGNWIRKLLSNNQKPTLEVLLEVEESKWQTTEIEYITKYKEVYNLTNLSDGGMGGINNKGRTGQPLTEEHRQKLSKAQKGRKHTPEAIEKMRNSKIGKKASPETRRKMSEARLGVKKPQSYSEKLSLRMLTANPTKKLEVRQKISQKKRQRDLLRMGAA